MYKPKLRGKCCWARSVMILNRYADASRTERPTQGYVSNEEKGALAVACLQISRYRNHSELAP